MKWSLLFAFTCFAAGAAATSPPVNIFGNYFREPPPPVSDPSFNARLILDQRITQKLDHFDDENTATWQMRYFSNSQYYAPGGPLFIFVGGEWEISYGWVKGGLMYDMAKEMSGYIFYTEHRYYGKSFPTSDASTENLKYLDINQALADLAHFIDVQRETLPGAKNSGVILVGGSYSASMVVWFKQAYPDKVNGVWASSAPLFAKVDFKEYKEVVALAIQTLGQEGCAERIERTFAELERLVEAGDFTRINTDFNLCTPLTAASPLDIYTFFSSISNVFAGLVQYLEQEYLTAMCSMMLDSSVDDIQALVNLLNLDQGFCLNLNYQAYVDYMREDSWEDEATLSASRQWFYQTCNEFGWFQTSTSTEHIFGTKFPVDLYTSMCNDIYSENFDAVTIEANILATNNKHNGFTPVVENVIFTHGEFDPWRTMGVQEPLNEENTPTVILLGYAHCPDLGSISSTDTEQMRLTKVMIKSTVREWLGV